MLSILKGILCAWYIARGTYCRKDVQVEATGPGSTNGELLSSWGFSELECVALGVVTFLFLEV